jgi:hypothetical protein
MNRNRLSLIALVLGVLVLSSCSGLPHGTGGGGGGNGSSNLVLTMISQSQIRPGNFTILAWSAQITSLTISDSSGNATTLVLPETPLSVDLNRLSTDTLVLGTFPLTPATSFTKMTIAFSNFLITIHNETGSSIGNACPNGAVCEFSPAPATVTITTSIALTAGQNSNSFLTVFPSNVISVSNAGISLSFTQNTPISQQAVLRAGLPANAVDTVEDFTGVVTAVSSNSITVKTVSSTGTSVALATTLSGTVAIDDALNPCNATTRTVKDCAPVGTIVSIDGVVNADGTITTTEVDLLSASEDALEGTIFSTAPGAFSVVVTDKQVTSTNTTLKAANIGDIFIVNGLTANTTTFSVDTKNLSTANPPVPVNLFTSSGDILNGQTVRLHVTNATGTAAAGNQTLTTDNAQLRFTRFTANSNTVSGSLFDVIDLGSFYQVANQSVVQTYTGTTAFDGVTDITGIGNAVAPLVSVRALFLNSQNNFYAAKVRHQ